MSGPDEMAPLNASASQADETLVLLMAAARRYGMKTDATDWDAVTVAAARARSASALLRAAASDRPLRAILPRRP